jgi:hypothetical protein
MASMNPHPIADALAVKKSIEREMERISIATDRDTSPELIEHRMEGLLNRLDAILTEFPILAIEGIEALVFKGDVYDPLGKRDV